MSWLQGIGAFVAAFLIGSLVEYSVHRWMHDGKVLGKKHADHHAEGTGQGWLGELRDYLFPAVPFLWVGFLISVPVGIGLAAGLVFYGASAAYAHQVQHENPELVFWLPRPVHYLHHRHKMWHHNFGIALDLWDRVFGTYRPESWRPEKRARDYPLAAFFQIRWR